MITHIHFTASQADGEIINGSLMLHEPLTCDVMTALNNKIYQQLGNSLENWNTSKIIDIQISVED